MSPHGTPDWWGQGRKITTHSLDDMAELAVRTGSFVNFDRRGEVLWSTSFDRGGGDCELSGNGAGHTMGLSSLYSHNGGISAQLFTGAVQYNTSKVAKWLRYTVLGGIGAEYTISCDANVDQLVFAFYVFTGTQSQYYEIRYFASTGVWQVLDTGMVAKTFTTRTIAISSATIFHNSKLVINLLTGKYMRFLLDDQEYNLSTYSCTVAASSTTARVGAYCYVSTSGSAGTIMYVDNFIVTQNEPV